MAKRTTIPDKVLRSLATECVRLNPYVTLSQELELADGSGRMYLYLDGKLYTRDDLDKAYYDTCLKDIKCGFNDRIAGYYDKWYRYSRKDEGYAYDKGSRYAVDNYDVGEMIIIPFA